jgi:Tol biopolymer transport system component
MRAALVSRRDADRICPIGSFDFSDRHRYDAGGWLRAITNLTSEIWSAFWPTYSPDGDRITFVSSQGGFISVVEIMDSEGGHQERLTRPTLEGLPADISPDGQYILVVNHVSTPITPYEIFRMNLDGTRLTNLSNPGKGHYNIAGPIRLTEPRLSLRATA